MTNAESTKDKIIEAATSLFAQKGFEGASVRDIASRANVNVAAVNYHFKNKQSLYWHVSIQSHIWLEKGVESRAQDASSIEELTLSLFDFLNSGSQYLKNAFLMFLSDSMPEMDEEQAQEMMAHKEEIGPPGGDYFYQLLTKEVGDHVSEDARKWAVKSIFSVLLHWVLILSTKHCQELYKDHPDFETEAKRRFLTHQVRSTLDYIKANHGNWKD